MPKKYAVLRIVPACVCIYIYTYIHIYNAVLGDVGYYREVGGTRDVSSGCPSAN